VVIRWAGDSLAPDVKAAAGEEGADAALLELAASAPAGCDGLVMLPYLLAERAPLWDPDLPGAYLGLRFGHTRAHLVRAALEGVCMEMRILLDRLDDVDSVRSVRVTGGVFRSALWREVMAAMLDRPIHVIGEAEGTALGAAALGLFALGRAPSLTGAVTELSGTGGPPPETVEPDRELAATYDALRASVPGLAAKIGTVAELFEGAAARWASPADLRAR
jgi:gluconokinase